jgi:hypothetical protein
MQKIGVPFALKASCETLSFNINIRVLETATLYLKFKSLFGAKVLEILIVISYKDKN